MKIIRFFAVFLMLLPAVAGAAQDDFRMAAQLLAAAKNANVQQVQYLVSQGANVNYVDATGVSIVCTALMNNDVRAAQILQMYGADASKCDSQIKQYNVRNKAGKIGGGGFFSGLSSVQSLTLASLGVGAVVGGLLLLTDVFDPGNDNDASGTGGVRPTPPSDGGSGSGSADARFALPYGPAMPSAETEAEFYTKNLNAFSPSDTDSILYKNFQLMTNGAATNEKGQNYLLMMHGYTPLARGYMGQRTLRNKDTNAPLDYSGTNLGTDPVEGGRPVNVAIVTQNGVNAANKAAGEVSAQKNSLDDKLTAWTTTNTAGTTVNSASNSMVSSKYYNNEIVYGADQNSMLDDATQEDATVLSNFDLAGWGTVVNNTYASWDDNLLAKVVGGSDSGYANADYFGFMPNGQMTIYRTGDGLGMVDATTVQSGEYTETDGILSEIQLFGKTLVVTMDGNAFTATDGTDEYIGYIGTNGYLYIDSGADAVINQAYSMNDGELSLVKELGSVDFFNYKAMLNAAQRTTDSSIGGKSKVDIIANSYVIDALHQQTVEGIDSITFFAETEDRKSRFNGLINKYYNNNSSDSYFPATDAQTLFSNLGGEYNSLVLVSTGATMSNESFLEPPQTATFENAVPLIYSNAEHYFMSIVAVSLNGDGTDDTESVTDYSPSGKIVLSEWNDVSTGNHYMARTCGIAGTGRGDIDPWCFAAAGVSDELAVSSAAGAAGAVKSAFSYLENNQIFALLALTADGPLLKTSTDGVAFTEETLAAYLNSMFTLPQNYQDSVDNGADYLDVFAEVFGYGLINLERATKPNTKIYYYDGNSIVSGNGNAYWRAATNTMFRPSATLSLSGKVISAPFYDVLESMDGDMTLPRIWKNEFAFGSTDKRGLYMGDVLGDMKVTDTPLSQTTIGNMSFAINVSGRAYDDYMNGLDNLYLNYANDNWNFGASYQRYLTDGQSRFVGNINPVLALVSNAIVSDVEYASGNWSVGARMFTGAVTDEGLLENDPTIAAQYMPAKLGLVHGAQSNVAWDNDKLMLMASIGVADESDTLLGAYTDGLLDLGGGHTNYVDVYSEYKLAKDVSVNARATFANTASDVSGNFILGLSDIRSNAFAFGAKLWDFEFAVAQPLAITSGQLRYAYADYDIVEVADGKYDLNVVDTYIADLDLKPEMREVRLSGTYRHNLGEFTDAAFGFIYRVNPNNTDEFGNETILMTKFSHRLGI